MENKYTIISIKQLDEFYPHYVGEKETQRLSVDGEMAVIKFFSENQKPIFDGLKIYSHKEILEILSSLDWINNNDNI